MADYSTMPEMTVFESEEPEDITIFDLSIEERQQYQNLVEFIDDADLSELESTCTRGLSEDEMSCEDWRKTNEDAMKLALQVTQDKSYPFENASNVIYPLITTGAVQFAARALPAIIPGREIVKAKVMGDDSGVYQIMEGQDPSQAQPVIQPGAKAAAATRVSKYMSHQLLDQEESWEEDTDTLLHYVPIVGCAFRKRYIEDGQSKSRFIPATDLIVHMNTRSLQSASRISERLSFSPFEIIERVRSDIWDGEQVDEFLTDEMIKSGEDICFIEQHLRYDLDGDGYPEPIIVWFHEDSGTVVRVAMNAAQVDNEGGVLKKITPRQYYVKYSFIPNPDGGFYDIGFGSLLGPINRSVNTAINQLFDAAHWQNAPSGFIGKRLRLKAGDTRFKPGEFKQVDAFGEALRNDIFQMNFAGPSPVTFNLLSLMIDAGRDISSVKDIMLGDMKTNVAPTTALTMVEQGTKQFTAIYKRIHRALKRELVILRSHNAENAELIAQDYAEFIDDDEAQPKDLQEMGDFMPVTDPDMVSESAAMAKANLLREMAANGEVNREEATRRVLLAANIEDIDALAVQPTPNPDAEIKAQKLQLEQQRIQLKAMEVEIAAREAEARAQELMTQSIKNLAQAEREEASITIDEYRATVEAMKGMMDGFRSAREAGASAQGDVSGMEGQRGDASLLQNAPQLR